MNFKKQRSASLGNR